MSENAPIVPPEPLELTQADSIVQTYQLPDSRSRGDHKEEEEEDASQDNEQNSVSEFPSSVLAECGSPKKIEELTTSDGLSESGTDTGEMMVEEKNVNMPSFTQTPEKVEDHLDETTPEPTENVNTSNNSVEDLFEMKEIRFQNEIYPIILQNENGPCPLIAICNVLLLQDKIKLPPGSLIISKDEILSLLTNFLLTEVKIEHFEGQTPANFDQNMADALNILPKLSTGLDVNIQFDGCQNFEYTQDLVIFDLLKINLFHGWLYDAENDEQTREAVGSKSYNQLIEFIINATDDSAEDVVKANSLVAQVFLDECTAQLTTYGLQKITETVKPAELCVLFRNNHFCTMYKVPDTHQLVTLVTDQGYASKPDVYWESLESILGDTQLLNEFFSTKDGPLPSKHMSEGGDPDMLLAIQLQEEENKLAQMAAANRNASNNVQTTSNEGFEVISTPPHSPKKNSPSKQANPTTSTQEAVSTAPPPSNNTSSKKSSCVIS